MKKHTMPFVSIVLILSLLVTGTLAYLKDTTEEVKNTFVFSDDGSVDVGLIETVFDETFDEDGLNSGSSAQVVANLIPGDIIAKNPTVTAIKSSCYLFIDVVEENNLSQSQIPFYTYEIDTGVEGYSWVRVENTNNADGTVTYVLSDATGPVAVDKNSGDFAILKDNLADDTTATYDSVNGDSTAVIGTVNINADLTEEDLALVGEGCTDVPALKFVAYAIQETNIPALDSAPGANDGAVSIFISEFK